MAFRYFRGDIRLLILPQDSSSTLVKVDQHDRHRPVPPLSILDHTYFNFLMSTGAPVGDTLAHTAYAISQPTCVSVQAA
jgi:hypothetical protein